MSAFFHFQQTLYRLFNNCIKLYWYKGGGQIDFPPSLPPGKTTFKKPSLIWVKREVFVLSANVLSPYNNKWVNAFSFTDRKLGLTFLTLYFLTFLTSALSYISYISYISVLSYSFYISTFLFWIIMKGAILSKAFNFAVALAKIWSICFSKLSFASIVTPSNFLLELFSICVAPMFTCTCCQYSIPHDISWHFLETERH